ncbi:hypothetical protein [Natronobacterium gregoryi]|uniref:Uncharacterized protein n=2 Tax=Natronobacterium gregoryi TaxID=44930 RepID=L0AKF9_NATGS|nr:hypothetical protein [Natronobacterium gregoryi]AFZ73540.1 hypothetical protein Natgr_2368 [Natronobacterium gregoryi SP2]ELY68207.1 hypothetical protein C490_09990 [Natronobacterium gregoryi SP2]PLK20559.1 hypothetical protein CYV19_08945 [Natronobacterium gregoryi SP2]SFJ17196.1 hypothetical protein SAMN05443661_11643 [Natronobacterium gregoryi]
MSRPPRPSRRRFLAAAGAGSLAALAGCTTAYSTLPNRLAYARTRRRSIPTVPAPVYATDELLHDLVDEAGEYAADALEVWDEIDDHDRFLRYGRPRLEHAAEYAEDRPWEAPTTDAVRTARGHQWQAASGYAYTMARLGEFDRDPTADAEPFLERANDRHAEFEYVTTDPATFLAYGRYVEHDLSQARALLSRRVDADVDDQNDDTSRVERIGSLYGGVQQNRARIDTAETYHDVLRERDPVSDGTRFDETMADARTVFHDRIEDLLEDREEWFDRIGGFEDDDVGESETGRRDVHSALYSRSDYGDSLVGDADRRVDRGYAVYGTVELAKGWLFLAAARAERERIVSEDVDVLDSGAIDAAKRDAVERLEAVLADDPDLLTLFFAEEAQSWIESGDRDIERSGLDDEEEDWRWSQANGYARYLLARGVLERIDEAVAVATGDARE